MQIINGETFEKWLPVRQEYRRYEFKEDRYAIRNRLADRCARLWFNPVITWDGKVLPCCFDKNADHIMGDLSEASFREIWNGPKYRIFRKSILSGRNLTDICRNCTSGIDWKLSADSGNFLNFWENIPRQHEYSWKDLALRAIDYFSHPGIGIHFITRQDREIIPSV